MPGVNLTGKPSTQDIYLGRGSVELALIGTNGKPYEFRHVGNSNTLNLTVESEKLEHQSSRSGVRAIDREIVLSQKVGITLTTDESTNFENLALYLSGTATSGVTNPATTASITDELIVASAKLGRSYNLVNASGDHLLDISATGTPSDFAVATSGVLHASTAGPGGGSDLVAGVDFELDATWGTFFLLSTAVNVSPGDQIYFTYTGLTTEKSLDQVNMLTESKTSVFLRFKGINPANSDKRILVDLHSVSLSADGELPLIGEEFAELTLTGVAERNEIGFPNTPVGRILYHTDA